jgi:Aspartyl protease/PDZ domain
MLQLSRLLPPVSFCVANLLCVAHAGTDPKAAEVLRVAATAAGEDHWTHLSIVKIKATLSTSNLHGSLETLFDAERGHYRNTQELGPASGADGFDGKVVWQQDDAGQTTLQGSEDSVRGAVNSAYQNARGYWHPERFHADIAFLRSQTEGENTFDVVSVAPQGGRPMEEWFDHRSHLLSRTVEQAATRTTTTYFSDYRPTLGGQFAYKIRQTTGESKYDVHIDVQSVSVETKVQPTAFSAPSSAKVDFGFVKAENVTTVPFKLINNHMYVEVKLNGKPYQFLFDTGGRNVLTPTTARELGLTSKGAMQGGGVGEQSADVGLTKVAHMEIGDAHLEDQTFVVIALESFGAVEGRPITGVFGYEVFKRFVVLTDYENQQIKLWDAESFKYSGNGKRVAFTFDETNPVVLGDIDGIQGSFTLDTGSRASLDLSSPFVVKHDLVKRWGARYNALSGWGVGGAARSSFARLKTFSLGGIAIPDTVVGLSQQRKGAESNIYVAGNVGAGVLKRFNIVWDYPHLQIFLEPNKNYSKPDDFDRAGLWANLASDGFEVIDVSASGPAAQAGLKAGDKIQSVNCRKAGSDMSLPEFRAYLRAIPGVPIKLDVLRSNQRIPIAFTLRDLF